MNGVTVRFLDFSEDGRVAVQVKGGTTHVLSYGDTIEVVKGGINLTVGSLSFSESSVLLVLYGGENISMGGEQPSNIQLESRFPSKITQPGGEDVVFTVRVRNLGQEGFVPVVVTAPRGGWDAKVLAGNSEVDGGVYLKSGETAEVSVVLRPPSVLGSTCCPPSGGGLRADSVGYCSW